MNDTTTPDTPDTPDTAADTPDAAIGTAEDTPGLVYYAAGARLGIPCECAQRGYTDNDGKPAAPDPMECGGCGSHWCARCHPTPAARCPFEYEHESPDLDPLPLGCVVAGTSTRRGEQTSALIVNLALDRGWFPSPFGRHGCHRKEAAELTRLVLADADPDEEDSVGEDERADVEETLGELAREAAGYLDSQAIRQTEHTDTPTRVIDHDGLHVLTAEEYDLFGED